MNIALIVAGGSGTRLKTANQPKQFIDINGKPLLTYSISAFENHPKIDAIVIVVINEYIDLVKKWCNQYNFLKVKAVISGGSTRQESVFNGLKEIKSFAKDDDIVLIHDAARPLISKEIINNNIEACLKHDAVTTALLSKDTVIHSINQQSINDVPNRKELYQSQTPQTFKLSLILEAHQKNNSDNATDDAQLVLGLGKDVFIIEGSSLNFKVTTDEDLTMLKALVK